MLPGYMPEEMEGKEGHPGQAIRLGNLKEKPSSHF